jgi:iron complex outermembrane receptor protein
MEMTLSTHLAEAGSFFTVVKPWVSYSLQLYSFRDYVRDGVDYAGNQITGNPENLLNLGLDLETEPGLVFSGNFRFVDSYPITDDNTVWNQAYGLLSAKLGYRHTFDKALTVDVFMGGENLLNRLYAGRVIFNSPTGNFYEPGLPRNVYGGAMLGVVF